MTYINLTPKERKVFFQRKEEVRENIANFIAKNIEEFAELYQNNLKDLTQKFKQFYDELIKDNVKKYSNLYSEEFLSELNAHCPELVDVFFNQLYEYISDKKLINLIKKEGRLIKDTDYYPKGIETKL